MPVELLYIDYMPRKRLTLSPDVILEWLLDRGYVEHTGYAEHPYRIAINEDNNLPYSITFLTKKLSERFSTVKLISTNRKVWRRELYKCFEEYQIKYEDKGTRGSMYWELQDTTKKYLEHKLNIDLDAIQQHDNAVRKNGGTRYTSYWHQQLNRYGEERALKLFERYFHRRMENLHKDLRNGKPKRSVFDDEYQDQLSFAHKQLSKDVEEVDPRPTSDKNNVLERLETSLDISSPVVVIPEDIA